MNPRENRSEGEGSTSRKEQVWKRQKDRGGVRQYRRQSMGQIFMPLAQKHCAEKSINEELSVIKVHSGADMRVESCFANYKKRAQREKAVSSRTLFESKLVYRVATFQEIGTVPGLK